MGKMIYQVPAISSKEQELLDSADKAKATKPVVPEEREGQSTKLADLPTGEPHYGFVPIDEQRHFEIIVLLTEIRDLLKDK